MKNLKAKLQNKGGFTLIEMLIVVAIIAILIAISIPLVGNALEKAKNATDAANERAFKGALVSSYLLGTVKMNNEAGTVVVEAGKPYAYDAVNGKVVGVANAPTTGYGQSTTNTLKGLVLYGYVKADGDVVIGWLDKGKTGATTSDVDGAVTKCLSGTVAAGT